MYGDSRSGQILFAVALILVGAIFLLQNYAGLEIGNWWAVFIFIPAGGALAAASAAWRSGMHPAAVSGPLVGGLAMLAVAAILLLELQWSRVWPVFLVLAGIGTLLPSLLGQPGRKRRGGDVVSRGGSPAGAVARRRGRRRRSRRS